MVIISKKILASFCVKHPQSTSAINGWYEITKTSSWNNFADVRKSFNSVDAVGNDRFIFNIKGNDYRLVAMIHFDTRTVYIRFLGTHSEYNKIDCSLI